MGTERNDGQREKTDRDENGGEALVRRVGIDVVNYNVLIHLHDAKR